MRNRHAIVGLIAVVGMGLLGLVMLLGQPASGLCHGAAPKHRQVTIRQGSAKPNTISAQVCDSLTFQNLDKTTREIAFGAHDAHVPYDGVAERFLNDGQSFTITLNAAGTYHWHDHLHDEVEGYFTVSK